MSGRSRSDPTPGEGSPATPDPQSVPDATVRAAIELVLSDVGDVAARETLRKLFGLSDAEAQLAHEAALHWIARRDTACDERRFDNPTTHDPNR